MATPVFCCGFECGITGPHWTLGTTSSFNTNASFVRNGARSLRINPTAGTGNVTCILANQNLLVVRVYVYFATLPNVDVSLVTGNSTLQGAVFKQADSKIYAGRISGGSLSTGATPDELALTMSPAGIVRRC